MDTTTRLALPYPENTDPPDGDGQIKTLAEALDAIVAVADSGPLSGRPESSPGTPGIEGRFYYDTIAGILYFDYGTGWASINPALTADGPPGTATLRSLGMGAQQAAAGNDARLSDQRVPTDGSVTSTKIAAALKPSQGAGNAVEALRAIGSGAGQVLSGAAGAVATSNLANGAVTPAKLGVIPGGQAFSAPTGQNIGPSVLTTMTPITLATSTLITGGMTLASSAFGVPITGWYTALGEITFSADPVGEGYRRAQLWWNESAAIADVIDDHRGANVCTVQVHWMGLLDAGATVRLRGSQNSNSTLMTLSSLKLLYAGPAA